jgi:hypothetical protein
LWKKFEKSHHQKEHRREKTANNNGSSALSNTVSTPTLGKLSLHHKEERNRRTGAEEKFCK